MVKFSWPLRAPSSRQQPSRSSSASAVSKLKVLSRKAGSVDSLIAQIETAEDLGLSDSGASTSTTSGNSLSSPFNPTRPGKVLLRTQSCNIESLSRREESSETLQEGDQTLSSILLLSSPITFAVDSAAEDSEVEDLTSTDSPLSTSRTQQATFPVVDGHEVDDLSPNTPLEFARFGLTSTESFNTSVFPLIQPIPDSPIGGRVAAPMKSNRLGLGTRAIGGSSEVFEPPRIELSTPKDSVLGYTHGKRIVLSSHSNFKEPSYNASATASISHPQSPKTPAMVTAPQTPRREMSRQGKNSNLSFDEPSADDEDDRGLEDDKGPTGNSEQGQDLCFSSKCTANGSPGYPAFPSDMSNGELPIEQGGIPGNSLENPTVHFAKAMTMTRIAAHDGMVPETLNRDALPASLPTNFKPLATPKVPNLTDIPSVAENVPMPSAALVLPNLPLDVTGIQSTPPTPGRKAKARRRGGKAIRKMRKALLRKPILNMVVGRQLAPPCKELLRLAASGMPFEVPNAIANTAPVPVPVPGVPA